MKREKRKGQPQKRSAPPSPASSKKRKKVSDEAIRELILEKCRQAGETGSIRPEAVAQALYPERWQTLLNRVRLTAKQLAVAGEILILRKLKPIPPEEMKGIIRLRIAPNKGQESFAESAPL